MQAAEVAALIAALENTQLMDEIVITSDSNYLISGLTKMLHKWEDHGWISVQNKDLIRWAATGLRMHSGETWFCKAKRKEQGPKEALQFASTRMEKPNVTDMDLASPECTDPTGAKLSAMTQALLYQGIMELKANPQRRGMVICLDMTRHGQYFTTPHAIHMDSSGLHWIPLDFTGLHYILDHIHKYGLHWTANHILTQNWIPLDSTGLSNLSNTKVDSTGLHWTASHAQHKTGLHWTVNTKLDSTGLHWTANHILTQNWTLLDSTGL